MEPEVAEAVDAFMKAINKPVHDLLSTLNLHVERTPDMGALFLAGKFVHNWNSYEVADESFDTRSAYAIQSTINDPLFAAVVGHAIQQFGNMQGLVG